MRTIAFDGRMGASGDMLLGALLAVGADPNVLSPITEAIDVEFDQRAETKTGIAATAVTVEHSQGTGDAEGHGPHRHFGEVLEILEEMALPPEITSQASDVFRLLAEAEATVHGTTVDDIHFHEVGADDAIADVTGSLLLLDDLDPDRVVTGPLATGMGEVTTSHGTYPIPPPAVTEIAARTDLTLSSGPVEGELLTPTGAAILGTIADSVDQLPPLDVQAVGYGAGTRSYGRRPNVLRVLVGGSVGALRSEPVRVLETHVDDTTPEILGDLQTTLSEEGAKDVSVVPLTMKKSRPGHLVRVIVDAVDEARVARRLAVETGTLGVRSTATSHRWVADREFQTVTVRIDGQDYQCQVKVARDTDSTVIDRSAEYEDAADIARTTGHPLRLVIQRVEQAAQSATE